MAKEKSMSDVRSQLKATSLKKLKKSVDEDNKLIGAYSGNEYLNLEDGKTVKIRIFPAHPGHEDFYVKRKCYWLSVSGNDGDLRRVTVLDSKVHGGTELDLVEEYVKFAKKKWEKDSEKLEALVGTGMNSNSLNPQYSWLCYAAVISDQEPLKAKVWEFKKMVRDLLNKLAFSEDEDEAIEVDPFTDVDEGLPVLVKYLKKPNKKKGENYYDVSFPKKVTARPLSDSEIEYFLSLKPLNEINSKYGLRDFETALEGLQNFDEENGIDLFEDEDWLERVEEVKAQYEGEEEEKPAKKKGAQKPVAKKSVKSKAKAEEEDDDEEEEEEEKPKASTKGKSKAKPEPEEEDDDEEEDDAPEAEEEEEDELAELDRDGLKKYIRDNELEITIKKSMSDDDIREAVRAALEESEGSETEEEEEEEKPVKAKISLSDIRAKMASKK